jgi:transcriptional regulator GlxA family with amidase domain
MLSWMACAASSSGNSRRGARRHGRSAAFAVARYLVVYLKRPGGRAQFNPALALQTADDKFGALHDCVNDHPASDLSPSILASQAGMGESGFP